MSLSFNLQDQFIVLNLNLDEQDVQIVSFMFPFMKSIDNEGAIHLYFKGPLDNISVSSKLVELKKFKLVFDEAQSFFDSSFMVKDTQFVIDNGKLNLGSVDVDWVGQDTFRRVTRSQKINRFTLMGQLDLIKLDILHMKSFEMDYDLRIDPTFISINFPSLYSGDVQTSSLQLIGQQVYPLTRQGRRELLTYLGTEHERGPLLKGQFTFKDGVFNVPKAAPNKKYMRMMLDLDMMFGPGNYVQGSIVGEGVYNLANNLSLEIDDRAEPFKVNGTLNSLNLSTTVPLYEGSITIFDGVYELIRKDKQAHYFKEVPEYISDQYIRIRPGQTQGQSQLMFDVHLRGLRKKDNISSTQNIRNEQFPYAAVGMVIDGDLRQISSGFVVLDYGLDSYTSLYPNIELYGAYTVSLSNQQSLSRQSYYGLNLVMPEIITNAEDASFKQYGRQQVNNFVKSSIRPYERRLAKRIGLYDLRIDYDFGRTLFETDNDRFLNQDLLGLNLVSNVFQEKMFLTVRADADLSSDESVSYQKGVKITQVALKYFFQPNFSVALKNINEYSDVTLFDPRFSLNYGYAF